MKKIYAFLICMLVVSYQLTAQQGFQIGVAVIPQNTWMYNMQDSKSGNFNPKATWKAAFGLTLDYHIRENVGAGLDIIYSSQGQNYKDANGFGFNYRVNYVKIPLLANFNSNPKKLVMFYGHIGPQLSFLTGAKRVDVANKSVGMDIASIYNKINFGAVLGFGAAFNLPRNFILTAGLKFDCDFTNAVANNSNPIIDIQDPAYSHYQKNNFLLSYEQNGQRSFTHNLTAGVEVGVKYLIAKKTKVIVY